MKIQMQVDCISYKTPLKYCERARSELFFSRGLMPFDGENSGFLVKSVSAKFLSSAKTWRYIRD